MLHQQVHSPSVSISAWSWQTERRLPQRAKFPPQTSAPSVPAHLGWFPSCVSSFPPRPCLDHCSTLARARGQRLPRPTTLARYKRPTNDCPRRIAQAIRHQHCKAAHQSKRPKELHLASFAESSQLIRRQSRCRRGQ